MSLQKDRLLKSNSSETQQNKFFTLIQKVGSKGKYQKITLLLVCLMWFSSGANLMNAGFLYVNRSFDCRNVGLLVQDCQSMICSLPKQQRQIFLSNNQQYIVTLATQFGPYYCEDQYYLSIFQALIYSGSLLGSIVFAITSDNFGRRKVLLISWVIGSIGILLLSLSQNIQMAVSSIVIMGFGAQSAISISLYYINQMVQNQARQKYASIIQIIFGMGILIVNVFYYFLLNWRWVFIILIAFPAFLALIVLVLYIQETPQFLIKQGAQKTWQALERISKINKVKNQNTIEQIQTLIQTHKKVKIDNLIGYRQLWKFKSLRNNAICCFCLQMLNYMFYFGLILLIDQIGFNLIVSGIVQQASELIIIIPSYFIIQKLPRRITGMYSYSICTILAIIIVLNEKPSDCNVCWQQIFELIIVFIFKMVISFYYNIAVLYYAQLFPSRAVALGGSVAAFGGSFGAIIVPLIIGALISYNYNPMIIYAIIGPICVFIFFFLKETQGQPIQQEILQIKLLNQQAKIHINEI